VIEMEETTRVYNILEVAKELHKGDKKKFKAINSARDKDCIEYVFYNQTSGISLCWTYEEQPVELQLVVVNESVMNLEFIDVTPIQLSEDEKVILRNVPSDFKWITRDEDGALFLNKEEPIKRRDCWNYQQEQLDLSIFDHLFQQIQWSDKEPTLIADLL